MSIGGISAYQGEMVRHAFDIAVMRRGLDAQKIQGEAAVKLIEEAGDVMPSRPTVSSAGTGQMIDMHV